MPVEDPKSHDVELPLIDALNDADLALHRRLLAGLSIGTGPRGGRDGAHELLQAMRTLEADRRAEVAPEDSVGAEMVEHILFGAGDDYPRRLYFAVSEIGLSDAVEHLDWLVGVLAARARISDDAGRMPRGCETA